MFSKDFRLLMSVSALLLCINGIAVAQPFPCKASPDRSSDAYASIFNMDPAYPVKFRLKDGQSFSIPYAFGPSVPSERVDCYPQREGFRFSFWMPDLRAPKSDPFGLANYRPVESGQSDPDKNHYLVLPRLAERKTDTDTDLPSRRFAGKIKDLKYRFFLQPKYDGLLQLVDPNGYPTPAIPSEQYYRFNDPQVEIQLDCLPTVGNPSCQFDIYYSDLQLQVNGMFPYDALPQWREISQGMHTLIQRWTVK
ncbi:hypothetical protein ACTJJ7_15605 [Phyllobacterium sp. 22229]|uniref:hypothetical protein n=1 Tax=Phyllobacterium sp. 22229 TaxID=3453895 RepID=UPI003F8516AF